MSKKVQENIVAFLFLFFFIGMLVMSMGYSPRSRLVPVPIAIFSLVLVIAQILLMNFKSDFDLNIDATEFLTGGQSKESIEDSIEKVDTTGVITEIGERPQEKVALLTVFVYLVLNYLVGIMPAIFIFVLGYFIILSKLTWIKALVISLSTVVFIWFFFVYLLQIQMYKGLLLNLFLS